MLHKKHTPQIIVGLDIGSTAIRIAVAQNVRVSGQSTVQIIGAVEVPSVGIQKGAITNIDETVSSISHALEQTERIIGVPIDSAWVGISGVHVMVKESKGVIAAAKPDGEITEEDVDRATEAARMVASPLNYEVLHALPRSFTVDGQEGVRSPVGMTGMRIEVDTQIIYGVTAHIKNITKAVYRTGIDIEDLVLAILAAGDVVTTARQKELGVAVVDIGGTTTTVVVYESGDSISVSTIPIGSEHVTNDLAIGLRCAIDVAERVKIEYAASNPNIFSKKEIIDLANLGASESEEVPLRYIAEIASARMAEILEKVDDELRKIHRRQLLPAGVLFTGGGAKITGLVDMAKEKLKLPAAIGYPINIQSMSEKVNDISFTTAIGLIRWASHVYHLRGGSHGQSRFNSTGKALQKLRNVWDSLIP